MVSFFTSVLLVGGILAAISNVGQGGVTAGGYRGSDTWTYVDRFVFIPSIANDTVENSDYVAKQSGGMIDMTLDFAETNFSNPALMLYFKGGEEDGVQKEFGFWERAYNTELSCEEKASIAQHMGGMYMVLPGVRPTTHFTDPNTGEKRWSVNVRTYIHSSRARWVFIAVGNCRPQCNAAFCSNSLDFGYTLNLTNPGVGENRMYFSGEKIWFFETALAFTVLYSLLCTFTLYTRSLLLQEKKYHSSVALLVSSIFFSAAHAVFYTIYYSQYAEHGFATSGIESIAMIAGLIADFLLLLMTILVAKGWTIVRRKISAPGRVRIAAYMTLYVVTSVACWVYFVHFVDLATVVYIYATRLGLVLVALRCLAFVWLSYAVHVTLRKYQLKRKFYKKFWLFVGCWILTLPMLVIINSFVEVWLRSKIVNLLSFFSTFLCQSMLIVMYNPSQRFGKINQNFPFHATTNMFMQKSNDKNHYQGSTFQGSNTFEEAHLLRAFQIFSQMRHSVVMLSSYTNDLHTFLDNIRQTGSGKKKTTCGSSVNIMMPMSAVGTMSTTTTAASTGIPSTPVVATPVASMPVTSVSNNNNSKSPMPSRKVSSHRNLDSIITSAPTESLASRSSTPTATIAATPVNSTAFNLESGAVKPVSMSKLESGEGQAQRLKSVKQEPRERNWKKKALIDTVASTATDERVTDRKIYSDSGGEIDDNQKLKRKVRRKKSACTLDSDVFERPVANLDSDISERKVSNLDVVQRE